MKVNYDRETDTLTVIFAETAIVESDEDKPGVILDYNSSGNLVSLEILDASRHVDSAESKSSIKLRRWLRDMQAVGTSD